MKTLMTFIVLSTFAVSLSTFAAIGCGGEVDCSPSSGPRLPGSGPNPPSEASQEVFIGYAEVPSPTCDEEDLELAIKNAKARAIADARFQFGDEMVLIRDFRLSQRCGQGIYSNSAKGNSWIVQAFVVYGKKKSY